MGQGAGVALALSTATYPSTAGTSGNLLTSNGTNWTSAAAPAAGIPTIGTSTNRAIATWNGTTGSALFDNPAITIDTSGRVSGAVGTASNVSFGTGAANSGVNSTNGTNVQLIANGSVQISATTGGGLTFLGGVSYHRTGTAISYTAGAGTDYIIGVTSNAAARTITLPNAGNSGQIFIVKDEAGTAASANNITVDVTGALNIDGAATYVINTNYGSASFYFTGSEYFTI